MSATVQQQSTPRRGLALVLAGLAAVAVVSTALVVGQPERAEAAGLERFASCAELEAWGADAVAIASSGGADGPSVGIATTTFSTVGAEIAMESSDQAGAGAAPQDPAAADGVARTGAEGDTTNVAVEGVDELDLIDRLEGDTFLVASGANLAIVDLAAGEVLARQAVGWDAQITYDAEAEVAWVVGHSDDGAGVRVARVGVGGDALEEQGSWTTPGLLVDARRVEGELHVVASDGFAGTALPFGGEAVPCDQVLHPRETSDPTATLVATLPATGDVAPVRSTQVVGSGQLVHVTTDAAYLATPQWAGDEPTTTIHRFDLASLEHTGSGVVDGTLLNDFAMSEHDGHLRVAITRGGGGGIGIGRPIPIEGDGGIGDVVASSGGAEVAAEPPTETTTLPTTSVPETTVPETTVPEPEPAPEPLPEPEPTVPETTVPEPEPTVPEPTVIDPPRIPEPEPVDGDPRNRIVVLDLEGDLDVVGETAWFGKPGESIFGIRFVGDTGYAVTFLQTDPFYVVDLADPAAPTVVGEVELPGFSAYLHPVGDDHVVGFGPDENGRATAKLFDVSDPTAPRVADSVALGDESPVVWDHHAFTSLGERRFAVPVTMWSDQPIVDCVVPLPEPLPAPAPGGDDPAVGGPAVDVPAVGAPGAAESSVAPCEPVEYRVRSEVVELAVDGDQLTEVARVGDDLSEPASRAIRTSDGWALLAGPSISVLDGDGARRVLVALG